MAKAIRHITGFTIICIVITLFNGCVIDTDWFGSVKDVDGNRYSTQKIGNQTWMTSDLRTTRFTDGTSIPVVEDSIEWIETTKPAFCWYDNNIGNKNIYGGLYNFYVFDTAFNGGKKLCPAGWHVPTLDDWEILIEFMGGYKVAGSKLKDLDFYFDPASVSDISNSEGFSAIPGGYRSGDGTFDKIDKWSCYWTSTEYSPTSGYAMVISDNSTAITKNEKISKKLGSSVRCVKD